MTTKRFWQVDAFSNRIFSGNAAAVVFDADDLSSGTMQRIGTEMNLSETVFLQRPERNGAHYKARIFTPRNELPFAGHPTVAAAFTVITSGMVPKSQETATLVQECGIGLVPVDVLHTKEGYRFRMTQAAPRYSAVDLSPDIVSEMLGCERDALVELPAELVSTGVQWLIAAVKSKARVEAVRPNQGRIESICREIGAVGLTIFAVEEGEAPAVKVRTFAPGEGIPEDPVCGSGNGSVAAYIARHELLKGDAIHYVAEQGEEISRKGKVWVDITKTGSGMSVQVGGQAVKVIDGVIEL